MRPAFCSGGYDHRSALTERRYSSLWEVAPYGRAGLLRRGHRRRAWQAPPAPRGQCISFGQRVQKSVFECSVNEMRLEQMRARLLGCIDQKADSLRIYRLIEPREEHVESYGRDTYVDFEEPLVL